jgi:RNA polymerase sigma-70 factor (ECF subfamily)
MMSLDRFEELRRYLSAIAYRMLGASKDAEDAVQDTWLRWQAVDASTIVDARAWLSRVIVRICIDRLTSARARRETYPGTWLPEPVATTTPIDLASIELGFLTLLERLDPIERAVFLLHQVFDYSHAEIAQILDLDDVLSRQVLHRAKKHLSSGRPRFEANRDAHGRLLHAFMAALSRGDVESIASVLREDAVLYGDGGGKVRGAILRPVIGRERVARFFAGLVAKMALPDFVVEISDVNGWPALIGRIDGQTRFVLTIETDGAAIAAIRNVVNPEKLHLRHLD